MSEFKVGEYALCVNDQDSSSIKAGESYIVVGFPEKPWTRLMTVIVLVNGIQMEQYAWRFEPVEKPKYSTPNGKHEHYDVIVAWANGAVIQRKYKGKWHDEENSGFYSGHAYRIKPEKSKAAIAAEKQLDDAEKAVFEAEKAVKAAKQALLKAQEA